MKIRLILIFSIVALITALIFQTINFEKKDALRVQFFEEKNALRDDLDDLIDDHELLKDEYSDLNNQLSERDSMISVYANDIKKLLKTKGQLNEAKKKIVRLKEISRKYIAGIDSLLRLNENLVNENDSVKNANRLISFRNRALENKNQMLSDRVLTASVLKISNIEVEGLHYRSSGKEVITNKAHKVQKFKICYSILENNVTEPGLKEIYLKIIHQDGSILKVGDTVSVINYDNGDLEYTTIQEVDYKNAQINDCFVWDRGNVLLDGIYSFKFYMDGTLIGETERKFK